MRSSEATTSLDGGSRTERSAEFWKYWTASNINTMGTGISSVALPLLALLVLDASNFEMGLLTATGYASVVLIGLPAGVIVRRYALRSLQVSMDVFQACAMLTIPLAVWLDVLSLAHLLVVALLVGLASNLYDVANSTFLPQIVSREQLIARNGLVSGGYAVTNTAGPAVGGVLVQLVGAAASIVVDSVSYLFSAFLLSRIGATGTAPRQTDTTSLRRQVFDGLRYVFRHPVIRPAVAAATVVNFANGAIFAVVAPFLVRTLDLPASAVGLVLAADGIGSVLGAALTSPLVRRIGSARALLLATVAGALLSVAMPLAGGAWAVPIFAVGLGGFAAGVVVLSVIARTHRQTVSPAELLSRVMASVRFVSWSAIPLGALSAGTAAELWGPRAGLVLAAVAAFGAPLLIAASRIRTLHELTDGEPEHDRRD